MQLNYARVCDGVMAAQHLEEAAVAAAPCPPWARAKTVSQNYERTDKIN
jgi:hypothetical protein